MRPIRQVQIARHCFASDGAGVHIQARREMRIATEEWLRVIPDFRVDTDEPLIERGGGAMNALLALPLAWDAAGDDAGPGAVQ